jgi:Domain of unknown function (DUF4262)
MCTFCEAEQAMLDGERELDPSLDSVRLEYWQAVDDTVARTGLNITYVHDPNDPGFVPFGYTTGLTRCPLPEMLVFGLAPEMTLELFNRVFHEQHHHCIIHSIAAASKAIGRKVVALPLNENVWDTTEYFVDSVEYNDRHHLVMYHDPLQLVVADDHGRFPWFGGYRGFVQPLLNSPSARLVA